MSFTRIRKPTLIALSLLLALAVLSLAPQPAAPASGGSAIALKAPSFVSVANAQEEPAAAPIGFPQDEAGISAYFRAASTITLSTVKGLYKVIEAETPDYLIGSVAVPDYPTAYDVHLFIHRDGWFLAYYLAADPTAKIVDWRNATAAALPTVLEKTLLLAATTAGVSFPGATYYDFRYPNATNLMLVGQSNQNGSEFQIKLPGTYAYYERSWSLGISIGCCYGATVTLDGTTIATTGDRGWHFRNGSLTAAQMLPDAYHTVGISYGADGKGWVGLAITYRAI